MIEVAINEALSNLEKYMKRRNDQEPVTTQMVQFYAAVCSSIGATEVEVKAAAIAIAKREEWFPAPATFVTAIETERARRPTSFLGVTIRDALGREYVYPRGLPLPEGYEFVAEASPLEVNNEHKDSENGSNT